MKKKIKVLRSGPILKYADEKTVQITYTATLQDSKPNTWYYVYMIERTWWKKVKCFFKKDYGQNVDFLFSFGKDGPSCPSGYKVKRRLPGAILTDHKNNTKYSAIIRLENELKSNFLRTYFVLL